MLSPQKTYELFLQHQLNFFTGVPDSLLKDFCAYVADHTPTKKNIITANEGNAIALAAGYHLATGKVGLVYLQNSGFGNCVNPLTSLTDPEVYSIPLLLLIGWRGEPGKKDEPQHKKIGKVMLETIKSLEIPYGILPETMVEAEKFVEEAVRYAALHSAPYAIIVREGTFEPYKLQNNKKTTFPLNREQAIRAVVPLLTSEDIIISTTGKTSRELFELRKELQQGHDKDFLTVGSMGHASSIALGIALQKPDRAIYCFDGDGAVIMHMGSLATIGKLAPKNFKHIIFNNFAHDSVGGQPTAADVVDFRSVAQSCGYRASFLAETADQITECMKKIKMMEGPVLLEIRCNKGARENLGRPTRTPIENKQDFREFLQK